MEPMYSAHYTSSDQPIVLPTEVGSKWSDRKGGFPHSEICGSKGARASPHLIAACHVLHRLSMPRHPSEALMRLIVLSKTHAWTLKREPHMRFYLVRHDVFFKVRPRTSSDTTSRPRSVGVGVGRRENPSFTMSFSPASSLKSRRQT